MQIPYNKYELMSGLCELEKKGITDQDIAKAVKECGQLPQNKKALNKKVAEDNGITVKQLIDSPNYKAIMQEWSENATVEFVEKLRKLLDVTDVQAWAIFAVGNGLLN